MGTVEIILEISKRVAELEKENEWLREDLERKEEEINRFNLKVKSIDEQHGIAYKQLQEAYYAECHKVEKANETIVKLEAQTKDYEKRFEEDEDSIHDLEKDVQLYSELARLYKSLFRLANAAKRHYRAEAWANLNEAFSDAMKRDMCRHDALDIVSFKNGKRCRRCGKKLSD